ncbi:MAG: adenylate kinase family protein [Thermoplasmata archaeon]
MTTALTGTPGVGKTTVSEVLRERGYNVLDLNEFIRDKDLLGDEDVERDTFEVEIDEMIRIFEEERPDIDMIEGHLSHYLPVSATVVLRCEPSELEERMENKGWNWKKIEENLEAEILDTILIQAVEKNEKVLEIDTTGSDPSKVASSVEEIMKGKTKAYEPGSIDWSHELLLRQ